MAETYGNRIPVDFPHPSKQALVPTQLRIQWEPGLSPGDSGQCVT